MTDEKIKQAINILNQGGIVIYPTDTAFGIGCRIDHKESIQKLFRIRQRPEIQAVPVLVNGLDMAKKYMEITEEVKNKLIANFWPGALTIIMHCNNPTVSSLVMGGGTTIGLRMPDHTTTLSLISGIGVPLLGPSANFHGGKTPYKFSDLDQELIKLVDYVLPGECKTKQASTVINCTVQPWKVIREGAVKLDY